MTVAQSSHLSVPQLHSDVRGEVVLEGVGLQLALQLAALARHLALHPPLAALEEVRVHPGSGDTDDRLDRLEAIAAVHDLCEVRVQAQPQQVVCALFLLAPLLTLLSPEPGLLTPITRGTWIRAPWHQSQEEDADARVLRRQLGLPLLLKEKFLVAAVGRALSALVALRRS